MKNIIALLLISLLLINCSSDDNGGVIPEETLEYKQYAHITPKDYVGVWEYYILSTDTKPYKKIEVTEENGKLLFKNLIYFTKWEVDDYYPPQELIEFTSYKENNSSFRKRPYFDVKRSNGSYSNLYYELKTKGKCLIIGADDYYPAK